MCHSEERFKQSLILVKRAHVRVEMGWLNAKGSGSRYRCANLCFRFFGINVRCRFSFREVKVAVAVQKRRHLRFSQDGTPAVETPLACERQVQTKIGFGMASRVGSYLGKP